MTHSFLIVLGTREKRIFRATQKTRLVSESESQSSRRSDISGVSDTLTHRGTDAPSYSGIPSRSEFSEFDNIVLEPEEDSRSITIDQVRDLQHQLSLKPYAADRKTGIILEAQRMTVEAQNALLKTLEEPPAHSVLILTAPSPKNLLPTIVSRCQITRLPPAIDLDVESDEYKKGVEEFLKLLQQGRGERLAWAEKNKKIFTSPSDSGRSVLNLLDIWTSVLRDLLLINSGCQSLTLNPFKPFTPFKPSDTSDLTKPLGLTIKTKHLLAATNVSPRLAIEVLLLDLPQLRQLKELNS